MLMRNVALVFLCAMYCELAQAQQPATTPSIVYTAHNPDAIKDYEANPRVVREMSFLPREDNSSVPKAPSGTAGLQKE